MDKIFQVFDGKKTIAIPHEVLVEYEEKVGAFTENTANYFMVVLDLSENMTNEELSEAVVVAMNEDCEDSACVKELLSDPDKREELFHVED